MVSGTIYNLCEIISTAEIIDCPTFSISGGLAEQPLAMVAVKISRQNTDVAFGFGNWMIKVFVIPINFTSGLLGRTIQKQEQKNTTVGLDGDDHQLMLLGFKVIFPDNWEAFFW